ncbi:MAG: glutathione S-transferase family protein [Polyangiaceae bacterium]
MGLLVDGEWKDVWYDTSSTGGKFERAAATFRGSEVEPEAGRYHLYVSLACPWAHRTLIVRALKGLESAISVSVVNAFMGDQGWELAEGVDPVLGARRLYEVYRRADPRFTGRVTVPVLWDKRAGTIVNNESSEIIRLLNERFDPLATRELHDLYPAPLREEIDAVNARVYATVNNGVYRAGFATSQSAYDEAVRELFDSLDWLEARLAAKTAPHLVGDTLTEADIRLFTTLVRFDAVYHGHFKCNLRRLIDYPRLRAFTKALYERPHVAETVSDEHIKEHYYRSHKTINPSGVVPLGPAVDYRA